MEQHHSLLSATGNQLSASDTALFRRLVAKLMYLTFTRPYISYSVHILSQFLAAPKQDYLTAAFKLVMYLK